MNQRSLDCTSLPTILDRELKSAEGDAFGHQHFADILRSLVERHSPPFSIGLLGHWGTGKSSIKEIYLSGLREDPPRGKAIYPITFNAWRHGGEDIKRALLRHVFLGLGGDEEQLKRELFQQIEEATSKRVSTREWFNQAFLENLGPASVFLALFVAVVTIAGAFAWMFGVGGGTQLTTLAGIAFATAAILAKYVVDIRLKTPAVFRPATTISYPSTSAEEYELLLLQQLKRFRSHKHGKQCERIVIFVDDLDRLSATEMVEGLDAVRTFLEIPADSLPSDLGLVFVISCDEDRVAEALAKGRGRLGADLPGSVFSRSDARRYLDRLFQFRLEIPRFPKLDMRRFAKSKLDAELSTVRQSLEHYGAPIEGVIDRLIHVGVRSPRNAIQLLNAFVQSWCIALDREWASAGSDGPGRLHKGTVTSHPLALAAVSVLRVDFPDLFSRVVERPQFLAEIMSVISGDTPTNSPRSAQMHLREFLETDSDGELTDRFKDRYRPLRTYLSSLQSLRLPKRIEPLLLLAEDSLTRRYGTDRAAELYDQFVSGDAEGVLEAFGRHLDDKVVSERDAELLRDMAEAVNEESEVRRINAARVLAELADRIPPGASRDLMTPLARQLVNQKQVRMNTGPERARQVLEHVGPEDRRLVAAKFCDDLLAGDVGDYRLSSGGTPNLTELVSIVDAACSLALWVRAAHGLPATADQSLLTWLEARSITSGEKARSLPFLRLDQWMAEHESHLLEAMGHRYSDLSIAECEADRIASDQEEAILGRLKSVFESLAKQGEDQRRILWEQLARLAAARPRNGVELAWSAAEEFADTASNDDASSFVQELSTRLKTEMDDNEKWSLDWEAGAQKLLSFVGRWQSVLAPEALEQFVVLMQSWSELEETAPFAAQGFRLIETRDIALLRPVLDSWSAKPLGDLHWPCRELLGSRLFTVLNAEQQKRVVAQLDAVVSPDQVEDKTGEDYVAFVDSIPDESWKKAPFGEHVSRFFDRIVAMSQNQRGYLEKLLPAATRLLACAPKGKAGAMLQQVFTQAADVPPAYVVLHNALTGKWPAEHETVGAYNAKQIFDRATKFMATNPAQENAGAVVRSMRSMINLKRVKDSNAGNLAEACCHVWAHDPKVLIECIDLIAASIAPAKLADLMETVPDESIDLNQLLTPLANAWSESQIVEATEGILAKPPIESGEKADGTLATWFDALPSKTGLLTSILSSSAMNDTQRERAYQQALRCRLGLGIEFFCEAIPSLLQGGDKTRRAVLDNANEIAELASSGDDQHKLSAVLIDCLPSVGISHIAEVAEWIHKLGGKRALEGNKKVIDGLDEERLAVVVERLKPSKRLEGMLASKHKRASTPSAGDDPDLPS